MTRLRRGRAARLLARIAPAALAGALTMTAFAPTSDALVLPTAYASLRGEGAWSIQQEFVPWANELATASSAIDLNYSARGSFFGREDFLAGDADFAISGVPFSPSELAKVKGGASGLIDAPIDVAALATFVEPPVGGFTGVTQICDPDDPSTWAAVGVTDGSIGCVVRAPVQGPIKIPNRNLVAMYLSVPGPSSAAPLSAWNDPGILHALGVGQLDVGLDSAAAPGLAGRSDPDEINYYLQRFGQTAAPDLWRQTIQLYPKQAWEPITERKPVVAGVTRDGAEQQVDQLANGGAGVGLGFAPQIQGGIAPAPPSTLRSFHSTWPGAVIGLADMQNANGDWVGPTPDAIDAAVNAGGNTPLYALTKKVPGAYPLVWVDHLYAPAHGLSIQKTEGLAMLIRYLATTGQEKTAAVGEGRLSPALVASALRAADDLVTSNCQGAGRAVVMSSDPGPLAPPTAKAMRSIGTMAHCVVAAPTTSTTASPTTVTTTPPTPAPTGSQGSGLGDSVGAANAAPSSGVNSPGSGASTVVTVPAASASKSSAGVGSPTKTGSGRLSALLTASKLPLPAPVGSTGSDRLATFLLGAALYLFARKPVARLVRKVAT